MYTLKKILLLTAAIFCYNALPAQKKNKLPAVIVTIDNAMAKGDLVTAEKKIVRALKYTSPENNPELYYLLIARQGNVLGQQGRYYEAEPILKQQLKLARQLKKGDAELAIIFSRLGIVGEEQAEYKVALNFYLKALLLDEKLKDPYGIAADCNNIGVVYDKLGDTVRARQFYKRALDIYIAEKYPNEMSNTYTNLGILAAKQGHWKQALHWFKSTLAIDRHLQDEYALGSSLANIGTLYLGQDMYDSAMLYLRASALSRKHIADSNGLAFTYNELADLHLRLHHFDASYAYLDSALTCARRTNARLVVSDIYQGLSRFYQAKNDYRNAFFWQGRQMDLKDSIFSEETTQQLNELRTQYAVEKQTERMEAKARIEREKTRAVTAEREHRQWLILMFVAAFLVVVLVFMWVLYKRFKLTRIQNTIIESQKQEVEIKNREITDSIHYASRIQSSLLPNDERIYRLVKGMDVMYDPRDVVSGDFYWYYVTPDSSTAVIAVADCTGHGVPGAFMSMIGHTLLNDIVKQAHIPDAATILEKLDKGVKESLKQSGETTGAKDGMDIAICILRKNQPQVNYASANRPMYVLGNNGITVLDHDKRSIGGNTETRNAFITRSVTLQNGERLFLFTDGVTDQFGGETGKKLKSSGFKKLLTETYTLPLAQQMQHIRTFFAQWKGEFEQTDDICMMAVEVI